MAKRLIFRVAAFILAVGHPVVVLIAAFGWLVPELFYLYGFTLFVTWLSWLATGSCVMAVWEFKLRQALDADLPDYEHGYLQYHARKLFTNPPSVTFIRGWGLCFLTGSLLVWLFNLYLL